MTDSCKIRNKIRRYCEEEVLNGKMPNVYTALGFVKGEKDPLELNWLDVPAMIMFQIQQFEKTNNQQ